MKELVDQAWQWLSSAAESALLLAKQKALESFQVCQEHRSNEALRDVHTLAKTKVLTAKATITVLITKTTTLPAKNMLNHWKLFQTIDKLTQAMVETLMCVKVDAETPMMSSSMCKIVAELADAKESKDCKLVQQCLGTLTAFQALWRQLRTGESRAILCKAAWSKRKDMYLSLALKKRLAAEANVALEESDLADDGDLEDGLDSSAASK